MTFPDFSPEKDPSAAEHALEAITEAIEMLRFSPFSCRKVGASDPFLRELVSPIGAAGDVAPFEIEPNSIVSILAVRHQREDD